MLNVTAGKLLSICSFADSLQLMYRLCYRYLTPRSAAAACMQYLSEQHQQVYCICLTSTKRLTVIYSTTSVNMQHLAALRDSALLSQQIYLI